MYTVKDEVKQVNIIKAPVPSSKTTTKDTQTLSNNVQSDNAGMLKNILNLETPVNKNSQVQTHSPERKIIKQLSQTKKSIYSSTNKSTLTKNTGIIKEL